MVRIVRLFHISCKCTPYFQSLVDNHVCSELPKQLMIVHDVTGRTKAICRTMHKSIIRIGDMYDQFCNSLYTYRVLMINC